MKISELCPRLIDGWGSGEYQAPRGNRVHKGIDLMCYAGTYISSHISGTVTKLGYTYNDDLSYRYVEITAEDSHRHRFFYIEPLVEVGQHISIGEDIGISQDIQKRYKSRKPSKYMCNHVHYEILQKNGETINPRV